MRFLTIAIRKCIPQRSPAPKHTALFTTVNLLLGVGPIIVPAPFFEAGFVLSLIWLVIILLMSYVSALYIAEAISKVSHVEYLNQERKSILSA